MGGDAGVEHVAHHSNMTIITILILRLLALPWRLSYVPECHCMRLPDVYFNIPRLVVLPILTSYYTYVPALPNYILLRLLAYHY